MARLINCGFELNSTANILDAYEISGATVQGTVKRSGSYALQITSLSSGARKGAVFHTIFFTTTASPFYARTYFRFATLPSADNSILSFGTANMFNNRAWIKISSTGTLKLFDGTGAIGSESSALSADTWYRIEMKLDTSGGSGACVVDALIDGSSFASATNRTISGATSFIVGGNINTETQTTGNWYFDDVALNNGTGDYENTYPGDGNLILLKPDSAGDSSSWTRAGTDSGANWSQVDEIPPDDATSYVKTSTANAEDFHNLSASGIGASDTVKLVAINVRMAGSSTTNTPRIKLQCKKTSGGTISQGTEISGIQTAWSTNYVPSEYSGTIVPTLTLYKDPDSSNWTQSTIDSMQIGYKNTTDGSNDVYVSSIWAYVEYTAGGASTSVKDIIMLGIIPFAR